LIRPVQKISALALGPILVLGFFANNILPFRMGEFIRAHLCGTKFKISRTASLGSILLERIFDSIGFLSTFLTASLFYPFPRYMQMSAWILGGTCAFLIAGFLIVRVHQAAFYQLVDRSHLPAAWNSRLKHLTQHFIHSTSNITQPRYVFEAVALSLLIWSIEGTYLYLMARAFDLHLLYTQSFFLLFALGISVTIPQAPGAFGTFEFAGSKALALLNIPRLQGLTVILAVHGTQFFYIAVLGFLAMWKEGLNLHNLTSAE